MIDFDHVVGWFMLIVPFVILTIGIIGTTLAIRIKSKSDIFIGLAVIILGIYVYFDVY